MPRAVFTPGHTTPVRMGTLTKQYRLLAALACLCTSFFTACEKQSSGDDRQLEAGITRWEQHDWTQPSPRPDSVLRELEILQAKQAKQDPQDLSASLRIAQLKVQIHNQLGNIDSSIYYAQKANETALELRDTAQIVRTLLIIHFHEFSQLQTKKIEKWIPTAFHYLQPQKPQDRRHGKIFHLYGTYLFKKADYKEAQRWLLEAYSIHQQYNDLSALGNLSIDLSNLYMAINSQDKAIEFQRQAIYYIRQLKNPSNLAGAINNLGTTYWDVNPDSAIYYYRYVIDSLPGADDYVLMAQYNLANVYVAQEIRQQEALQLYADVRRKSQAMDFDIGVLYADLGLAYYHNKNRHYPQAMALYEAAAQRADSFDLQELSVDIRSSIIDVLEEQGRYEQAYRMLREQHAWKDSVTNLQTQVAIHDLELFYESENQKLARNKLITRIENQQLNIRNRSLLAGIATVVMAFFILLAWRAQRRKATQLEKLHEKYRLLAELEQMKSAQSVFYEQLIAQQQQEIMTMANENQDIRLDLSEKQLQEMREKGTAYNALASGSYWQQLSLKFSLIYPGFIDQLQKNHPRLTQNDLQLCMLIKLGIPLKEIAGIFNITTGSLYKKKYRIEEKMNLKDGHQSLEVYLEKL